jgi:hypothetical protein
MTFAIEFAEDRGQGAFGVPSASANRVVLDVTAPICLTESGLDLDFPRRPTALSQVPAHFPLFLWFDYWFASPPPTTGRQVNVNCRSGGIVLDDGGNGRFEVGLALL